MSYTKEQQQIIDHSDGHALVNAVAGSGKTTVMVGLIEKLAQQGIDPKKIMVLMFNKTAREDFQHRLRKKMQSSNANFEKDRIAEIRTLSSLSYKIINLLQSSEVIPEYKVLIADVRLQNPLFRQALSDCDVPSSQKNIDYLAEVVEFIKSRHDDQISYMGKSDCIEVKLFHAYEKLRHKSKIRFSSDWSYDTITAVKESPDLLHDVLSSRFKYIIVDEFQDINPCQMMIIDYFVNENTKIIVVGDVNQSIYAWRGSCPDIMLKSFPDKYKPTTYNLSKTFRFGHKLSQASNNLISNNKSRFEFDCHSDKGTPNTKINILQNDDYKPQEIAKQLVKGDDDYSSLAVLGRERCNWFETEFEFLKHSIPYQLMTTDQLCVLDTVTIQSLLGYLRLANGATGLYAMDKKVRRKLISNMLHMPSLYLDKDFKNDLINRLTDAPDSYQVFPEIKRKIKLNLQVDDKQLKYQCDSIDMREEIWDVCLGLNLKTSNACRALKLIYTCRELNYKNFIQRSSLREKDANYKIKLINGLFGIAEHVKDTHTSIGSFLEYINSLYNSYQDSSTNNRPKCVTITTMHRSKGLEWDNVVLPDLYNTTMPVLDDDSDPVDLEGDRRLLYVAMTRAKENVYLVGGKSKKENSQFLKEI